MKAVSALISVIVILLISVALVATAYIWFTGVVKTTTETGAEQTEKVIEGTRVALRIESIADNNIYVRNLGEGNLSNFSIYFEDSPVVFTSEKSVLTEKDVGFFSVYGVTKFGDIANKTGKFRVSTIGGVSSSKTGVMPKIVFFDDFNDGDDRGWKIISGMFNVTNQIYRISGNGSSSPLNIGFKDFVLEYKIKQDIGGWAGAGFRRTYATPLHTRAANLATLFLYKSGTEYVGSYSYTGDTVNTFVNVRVEAIGQTIKVYLNDVLAITYSDPAVPPDDSMYLYKYWVPSVPGLNTYFDDVRIIAK